MIATTADLFRNLALAWWPLLLVAALVALPWLLREGWRWLMARNDLYITHMVDHALDSVSLDDLMDGDDWAADNGYVDSLDAWAAEPLCKGMSDGEAVLFAAAVLSDIDELTREAS